MKKVLLAVALMLTVGIVANAQFKVGVKAGANIVGVNDSDSKMRGGITAGVLGHIKLGEKWAIQPEVLFNMQGAKKNEAGVDQKWRLNYIAVPVMAQFYVLKGLNVELGPQFGILLSSKTKFDGSTYSRKDATRNFELAIGGGAAYELPSIPIGFFGRYTFGITEISKTAQLGTDLRNYAIQIGAFVKF